MYLAVYEHACMYVRLYVCTCVQVYGSSEVQQHLPTHVYTFSNVDREWRDLMKTTVKNPAVINVCLKEGKKIHCLKYCIQFLMMYFTINVKITTILYVFIQFSLKHVSY